MRYPQGILRLVVHLVLVLRAGAELLLVCLFHHPGLDAYVPPPRPFVGSDSRQLVVRLVWRIFSSGFIWRGWDLSDVQNDPPRVHNPPQHHMALRWPFLGQARREDSCC